MKRLLFLLPKPVPRRALLIGIGAVTALGCAGSPKHETLAELRNREPDLTEAPIDDGIDQAMAGYRKFLAEAPKSALTPEAMRRLADLKLEKEFGILGGEGASRDARSEMALPESGAAPVSPSPASPSTSTIKTAADQESTHAFEQRMAATTEFPLAPAAETIALPGGKPDAAGGPLEAIRLYDEILEAYPNYAQTDQVLYQKARAFDELGRVDEAVKVAALLVERYPESRHIDEIQFRRAEYYFTRKKYFIAEESYAAIVDRGPGSSYYELALYKLGWAFYKQMMLDEALEAYLTLLDHKVTTGYDFDQVVDETEEQRIADTYRVMSLCFSDLGGPEAVTRFFGTQGKRTYEDRVYKHLGEFYLEKRRFNDAALTYEAFVELNPTHKISPHFSMRVVEIYDAGNFPKLVLASKKKFAASYGLDSDYWNHFETEESPEVLAFLKGNLEDLANHYHALYQDAERPEEKPAHFAESAHWYRAFLTSFPTDADTPGIHYQLADLLLQNEDFREAADEYERIAYEYPAHERSSAAGYAAIFAHRQFEKQVDKAENEAARRESVASTIRFVDTFPTHEKAAAVLGAAIDDLYDLKDFLVAISTGHRLLTEYPNAEAEVRRSAWAVIAHASFDTEAYEAAEQAYISVLGLSEPGDEAAVEITNNLAATIYKQGEQANAAKDHRAAADHFLRIATAAPTSTIRPIAQYDAASALIELADWNSAAGVLTSFRADYPEHELSREATRQVAFVYREDGNLSQAAEEYVRVAAEASEPDLRRESLLVAAELYEEVELITKALSTYSTYVTQFTKPIEPAVVARFKMAELYYKTGDEVSRRAELARIVEIDRVAGPERTDGVRVVAGRSALILSEEKYDRFAEVELTLPFDKSLAQKKKRMDGALKTFQSLLDYEVGEVTSAATYYMAEIYGEFSRALLDSERPTDLSAAEREEYEMVLEEEAYPFEEKAITVHEKNLELMRADVWSEWIEKSLARLADVMPGRYAKFEASSGLLDSMTTYAYQSPRAAAVLAMTEPVEEAEAETDVEAEAEGMPSEEMAAETDLPATEMQESQSVIVEESAVPAAPASNGPEEDLSAGGES